MDIKHYRQTLEQPWGKIFYSVLFEQLKSIKEQNVLDFGAGVCLTAAFLAKNNSVTAIEPNVEMLYAEKNPSITKLSGSLLELQVLPDQAFDTILCHNVLEYIRPEERPLYLAEFERLLKPEGQLSLVKHNQVGKVMQAVVFANDTETALDLLAGKAYHSPSFSQGQTYIIEELLATSSLKMSHYQGIRTFYALQPNEFKQEDQWLEKLSQMELAVSDLAPYKDIAFFHHVWLKKEA